MNALIETLRQRAHNSPDDIVIQGSELQLSARDLLARSEQLAAVFARDKVSTVALLAENSPMWVVIDIACQISNCCIVPIPTFFTKAQVTNLLGKSGADLVIFEQGFLGKLPAQVGVSACGLVGFPQFGCAKLSVENPPLMPPKTGKITFTSGSTGEPKGVCLSTEQCVHVAQSLVGALDTSSPRHLCLLPLSILLENIGGIYMPLLADGCAVVLSPEELGTHGSTGLDVEKFLSAISDHQPNTLITVPEFLAVLDAAMDGSWQPPSSLQFVAVGGAKVSPQIISRMLRRGLPVYEGYGLSECGSVVSLNTPRNNKPGTSGRVLPHVQVRECDGELLISGNTFLGYLNEPDSWQQDTIASGDLGRVDADGYLIIEGRSKNVLISSFGRNINPEWVESELSASGVFLQAIVIGDGRPQCMALLFPRDRNLSGAKIQAAIDTANRSLPDYARIGHWLELVEPLTSANGLLTDNGRPRREHILRHFGEQIDQIYFSKQRAVSQ